MRRLLLLLSFLVLAGVPADAAPKGWWNRKWSCRKHVRLTKSQRYPTAPAASMRFGTAGRTRDDFADLRVVTADRKEIPHAVIAHGPGDQVEIVFPVGSATEWFVYYGNPDAAPIRSPYVPDRGLVLTTRVRAPGNPVSWPAMEKILALSTKVHGGKSWKRVFDAENPFGPSDHYVSDYRGFLLVTKGGTYTFYTASDEASFMFVDDRLVVMWPGWHGAGRGTKGLYKGRVELTTGLHPFRYVHIERTGAQAAAAYWQPPGARRATVIPEAAFPGHRSVGVLSHEVRDHGVAADFVSMPRDKWGLDGNVYTGVLFRARETGRKPSWRWEFGDGVTAEGQIVYHVYAEGSDYEVRLTAREGGEEDEIVRPIRVIGQWTRYDRNRDAVLRQMAKTVAGYPPARLSPRAFERAVFLLDEADRDEESLRFLVTRLRTARGLTKADEFRLAMDLGRRYSVAGGKLGSARWAYAKAISAADPKQADFARVDMAEAMIVLGGNHREAATVLEGILKGTKGRRGRHFLKAWIRLGDARMLAGDGPGARVAYEMAEKYAGGKENVRRLLRKAAAARTAMTLVEKKQPREALRSLGEWERLAPTDRFIGLHRIVNARALVGLERVDFAIRELTGLLAGNADSEYADRALALLASIEKGRGNAEAAAKHIERLKKDYPWSPYAAEGGARTGPDPR